MLDQLRARFNSFDQGYRHANALSASSQTGAASDVLIRAAVLVPVVLRSPPTVLLTQRTAHLRDHAGQISFPGGRCEHDDADVRATALREAEEEVGLRPEQVEVLGCLPEYLTGTGFCVTPVVGLVTPPLNLRLDDFEVADVFEPPLEFLLNAANHRRDNFVVNEQRREFWAIPWQERYIWGATAGMLVSLAEFLGGPQASVDVA